jgi:hypothetical protein
METADHQPSVSIGWSQGSLYTPSPVPGEPLCSCSSRKGMREGRGGGEPRGVRVRLGALASLETKAGLWPPAVLVVTF